MSIYSSFAVMGLWHEISLQWLMWGSARNGAITSCKVVMFEKKYRISNDSRASTCAVRGRVSLTVLYSALHLLLLSRDIT